MDNCIREHGENEQLEKMKQAMIEIQKNREKTKISKEKCEAER